MKKWIILNLIVFTSACKNSNNNERELAAIPFNQEVIRKISQYDSVRREVLNYHDSFHFETFIHEFGDQGFVYNHTEGPQELYFHPGIPIPLYEKILPIINNIGESHFTSFAVARDNTIVFPISSSKGEGNHDVRIYETLIWYPDPARIKKPSRPNSVFKDTSISPNWRYQIEYWEKSR